MAEDRERDRKEIIKGMIRRLHEGESPESVKKEFEELAETATPTEIAQAEEALVAEGVPREEIRRLCDVHLSVVKKFIEEKESLAPDWHPVQVLFNEHKVLLGYAERGRSIAKDVEKAANASLAEESVERLRELTEELKKSQKHYEREENVLFPYLEKHGITQPPAVMWMEHDRIRELEKELYELVSSPPEASFDSFKSRLSDLSTSLEEMLESHFYKENNVLFPAALEVIEESEWPEIREQFDQIGYFAVVPPEMPVEKAPPKPAPGIAGEVSFHTGSLSVEQLEGILNALPAEITFIDAEDTVKYFNQPKDVIFVRTKAVIGRKVQQCHPQKSLDKVNQIVADFKSGVRDVAEFWIDLEGRKIHIRFFPVRNEQGDYLGCLEVVQDITEIQKLTGEKRLLEM